MKHSFFSIFALTALSALAGCSGGSSDAPTGTGSVSLAVSDTPVRDAHQVCIEFAAAEFKKAGSPNEVITFDPPVKVDLLAYQGMNAAPLLVGENLEAGEYQWVRLDVNAARNAGGGGGAGMNDDECLGSGSYIVTDMGEVFGLYVPSEASSGLKLVRGFTLPVGGEADFIAEFDLMKSVHAPEGSNPEYILRPTIQLLDRSATGSIAGEVSMELATADGCEPTVYLFTAGDVPDDNEDDAESDSVDPVTSVIVEMDNDGRYLYEIGPVSEESYDVAFSCQSDEPLEDEVLDFTLSADNPVSVVASQESVANF